MSNTRLETEKNPFTYKKFIISKITGLGMRAQMIVNLVYTIYFRLST